MMPIVATVPGTFWVVDPDGASCLACLETPCLTLDAIWTA